MRVGGLYIPDSIAFGIFSTSFLNDLSARAAASAPSYSGRAVPNIKKVVAADVPPVQPAAVPADPTTKILWIGAATSVGGLAIETSRFLSERKGK